MIIWLTSVTLFVLACICFHSRILLWLIGLRYDLNGVALPRAVSINN
ncbi:hypothetical protein LINPERPRIM_LOCUS42662 [Linum perenne]